MKFNNYIKYKTCETCVKPVCKTNDIPIKDKCNCDIVTAIDTIVPVSCEVLKCDDGCEETIKAECVVVNNHCFVEDCNCNSTTVSLEQWISAVCMQINNLKIDVENLKKEIPGFSSTTSCVNALIKNIDSNKIDWKPSNFNLGQTLYYRPYQTSMWYDIALNSFNNAYIVAGLIGNQMYEYKIKTKCLSELETDVYKEFNVSLTDWNFESISSSDIKISWDFASISNIQNIKLSIYNGVNLIATQTLSPTNIGFYLFMGLTNNTTYTIVYGLTYTSSVSFPKIYIPDVDYLTPVESLTEYKRKINVSTL